MMYIKSVTNVAGIPASIPAGPGNCNVVTTPLFNLITNTKYYYRVKGVNSAGTGNGAIFSFTTINDAGHFITKANGTWNNPATWESNTVPSQNTAVIVRHPITVTFNTTCYSLKLELPNTLTVSKGTDFKLLHSYR